MALRGGSAEGVTPHLEGRRIVVTGASRGIGRTVAITLARQGAQVVLVARSARDLETVLDELPGDGHDLLALDVRDEHAWTRARDKVAPSRALAGVVAAASIVTPVGAPGSWGIDRFRETFDVNVAGTLLTILTFLDFLAEARGSIVTFSGGGATKPLPGFDAYAASKAAIVRLTENLATELAGSGIRINSVSPGFVVTGIHQATLDAGPAAVGQEYYERTRAAVEAGGADPPELAAELVAFLMSESAIGISGKLISARWDPWRSAEFQDRLRTDADFATLRRIDDQFFTAMPETSR